MINKKIKYILVITFVLFGVVLSLATSANASSLVDEILGDLDELIEEAESSEVNDNYTVVSNSVTASANTGGNTANAGEVVEGKAKAEIKSKTIINGEVVEDINIREESVGDVDISVKSEVKADEQSVKVDTTTIINGVEQASEKSVTAEETPELLEEDIEEIELSSVCAGPEDILCGEEAEIEEEVFTTTEVETGFLAFLWNNVISKFKNSFIRIFSFLA